MKVPVFLFQPFHISNVGFTPSRRELKNNDLRKSETPTSGSKTSSLCHLRIGGDGF
ncbi:hypothetical protein CDS [Salmonella enterica subsp. enterica serovar Derby]|nr:hypothetical protein CDS [Salmonella enterica subsp. enterica serovar Derby]